jgi:phytoene dehydrogenase-like protein
VPVFPATRGEERLLHGRILVGATGIDALERAFDAAKYGRISDEPVLETSIPSMVDPSLVAGSPEGTQVMSVHVQWTPYDLRDGGAAAWDSCREDLGDRVLGALERVAPGIGSLVTARRVLTPLDLEREYGLTGGHPYHVEPALESWFLWRPFFGHARYRAPIDGLYLCGPGTHPGGGITGAPGQNAAREIVAAWKKRRR